MLKIKKGFLLRKLGEEFMAVAIGDASKDFNGMIRLNGMGAFYWEELEKGSTEDELVRKTLEAYTGAEEDIVRSDVKEFLDSISIALEDDAADN